MKTKISLEGRNLMLLGTIALQAGCNDQARKPSPSPVVSVLAPQSEPVRPASFEYYGASFESGCVVFVLDGSGTLGANGDLERAKQATLKWIRDSILMRFYVMLSSTKESWVKGRVKGTRLYTLAVKTNTAEGFVARRLRTERILGDGEPQAGFIGATT